MPSSGEPITVHDSLPPETRVPTQIMISELPSSQPASSATEEATLESAATFSATTGAAPQDSIGFPRPRAGRQIPEDDGMSSLRFRIHDINAQDITSAEKARFIHDALLEGYRASRHKADSQEVLQSPDSSSIQAQSWEYLPSPPPTDSFKFWPNQFRDSIRVNKFILNERDVTPTYAPIRHPKSPSTEAQPSTPPTPPDVQPPLGCQHYERSVKVECSTCGKWYTCVFCHDDKEDHNLNRKETKHMLCMLCATPQKASDFCIQCNETIAQYYCKICKLWENRSSKPIYHCNDCGICRRGMGLGKDFFHCKVRISNELFPLETTANL